jgi:hypothetical protein
MAFYLDIDVCGGAVYLCLPCEMNCFSVIELSNWSFYFQWDSWLLVYQFCITRTKEHTCICILNDLFCHMACWLLELRNLLRRKKKQLYLAYFVELLFVGNQWWRWCACYVWMFNQLVQIANPLLAMDCPWQSIIVAYASSSMMKGNTVQIYILVYSALYNPCLCRVHTFLFHKCMMVQFPPLSFETMMILFLAPNIWMLILLSSYCHILLMNSKLHCAIFFSNFSFMQMFKPLK